MNYLGFCINVENINFPVTQYVGWDFNSICKFNGKMIGANADGIFELGKSTTDDGVGIRAWIKTPTHDYGSAYQKRVRAGYIGGEADGKLTFSIFADEQEPVVTQIEKPGQRQRGMKVPGNRAAKGRFLAFEIANSAGCDFSIDSLEITPIILNKFT